MAQKSRRDKISDKVTKYTIENDTNVGNQTIDDDDFDQSDDDESEDDETEDEDDEPEDEDDETEDEDDEPEDEDDEPEDESDDDGESEREPLVIKDLMTSLVIPKGEYDAMIVDITVENKQGKYGKFNFLDIHLIVLVDGEEIELKDRMTVNVSENSKLGKLLLAVLGKMPKLDFDLTALIEDEIGVKITHRKDENGRTWPEIEYIR